MPVVTIGRVAEQTRRENTADKDKIISDLTLLEIAKTRCFSRWTKLKYGQWDLY
jgi:hypothetical protein